MALPMTTITGNLTRDPELKHYEKSGTDRARLRVAVNRRYRIGDTWHDADPLFMNIEAWGQLAQNCKISLVRGMPVIATGHLTSTEWQVNGEEKPRTQIMLKATHVGLDLNRHIAASRKLDPENKLVQGINIPDHSLEGIYDAVVKAPEPAPEETEEETAPEAATTSPPNPGGDDQPGF